MLRNVMADRIGKQFVADAEPIERGAPLLSNLRSADLDFNSRQQVKPGRSTSSITKSKNTQRAILRLRRYLTLLADRQSRRQNCRQIRQVLARPRSDNQRGQKRNFCCAVPVRQA